MAKHNKEETWNKISAVEEMVAELGDRQEYLTAMQTVADTPTTISVPSGDLTDNTSIESVANALLAALLKSGDICNQANQTGGPSGGSTAKSTWRKVQYYCYTHGADVSHSSKDCKNPLGEHTSKPNALDGTPRVVALRTWTSGIIEGVKESSGRTSPTE